MDILANLNGYRASHFVVRSMNNDNALFRMNLRRLFKRMFNDCYGVVSLEVKPNPHIHCVLFIKECFKEVTYNDLDATAGELSYRINHKVCRLSKGKLGISNYSFSSNIQCYKSMLLYCIDQQKHKEKAIGNMPIWINLPQ